MQHVIHKANTRGFSDLGWLQSYHTFNFGTYYDHDRKNFGVLRVLNDDTVAPGKGFPTHGHTNMEIISIPLEGSLEHSDNMGNKTLISHGDIQIMSAGTGIYHSEYNKNPDREMKFLQIWIMPSKRNIAPRYDQMRLNQGNKKNILQQIVSPDPDDEGIWINQNAWFHIGNFDNDHSSVYDFKSIENGLYVYVLKGEADISGNILCERDGMSIWDTTNVKIKAMSKAELLLMEIPLKTA